MADSIKLFIPIAPMSIEEYRRCKFPFEAMQGFNRDKQHDPFFRWETVVSPLTGAKYKVKSVLAEDGLRLKGYLVKMNVPASVIGHNYLLTNGVPFACKLAYLLLSYSLRKQGATEEGMMALQFEKARLMWVTLTYLFMCSHLEDSHEARREFARHSEALYNKKGVTKRPAFSVGPADKATSYIRTRHHVISAYVKDGYVEGAYVDFESLKDEPAIRSEAEFYLRVEVELQGSWLAMKGLDKIDNWVLGNGRRNQYEVGVEMIRTGLRLDEGLRKRAPKEEFICSMAEPDQTILRSHLNGGDARKHWLILAKDTTHQQNVYYSAIKNRLLKKVKVDISIEWAKQSEHLSPRLAELIRYTGDYEPPMELAEKVYSRASAPERIAKMESLMAELLRKR